MRHLTGVLLSLLPALAMGAEGIRTEIKGLRMTVPAAWVRVPASSDVRAAQFRISHTGADTEDGEFVVFFFGKGQGGSADDNLQRWYDQFMQPDGKSTKEKAVVTSRTVAGLKITQVDVTGTYKSGGPGGNTPRPNTRMLAAVVEGGEGPWFLKVTGPTASIAASKNQFDALILSVEEHR